MKTSVKWLHIITIDVLLYCTYSKSIQNQSQRTNMKQSIQQ